MSYHSDDYKLLEALGITQDDLHGKSTKPDRCEKKQKKVVNHFSKLHRMVHRELLSRPICRKLRPWPNPSLEGPYVVSAAALRAKMTDRLERLAMAKEENDYCKSYYSPAKSPGKLKMISSRLVELSKPRPSSIDDEEEQIEPKRFKSKTEWMAYLKKLRIFGAARRPPPSPRAPKRIKKPLEIIMERIDPLSKPVQRPPDTNEKTFEELYTIKSAALKYIASNRTKKLAVAKQLNEQTLLNFNYDPRYKLLNAKKYIATDRIIELSTPKIRETPKAMDVNAYAFKVNPGALKAWCSPRIKQLAKPVIRD